MHHHTTAHADAAFAADVAMTIFPVAADRPLIAGRLARETDGAALPPAPAAPLRRNLPRPIANAMEVAALRAALVDERSSADRTVDSVVDRLLAELSW